MVNKADRLRHYKHLMKSNFIHRVARYLGKRVIPISFEGIIIALVEGFYRRKRAADSKKGELYFDQRISFFETGFTEHNLGVGLFKRGFVLTEILSAQDRVLDLGCGDGFFTSRFYAPISRHVDAVDISESALRMARRNNSRINVSYHKLDFLHEKFPHEKYDVIVLNALFGTFNDGDLANLFKTISGSLSSDGIFVGCWALNEDKQTANLLKSREAITQILLNNFPCVRTRQEECKIVGRTRTEAFWQAAPTEKRFHSKDWVVGDGNLSSKIKSSIYK